MSLDSREDYLKLNEHLYELGDVLADYASGCGYSYHGPTEIGLYPKISIDSVDSDDVTRSIQISMDLDQSNERYAIFFPEIPYTIFAAVWLDENLDRWHGPNLRIERIPFCSLVAGFEATIALFHDFVEQIGEDYIRSCNVRSVIMPPPE